MIVRELETMVAIRPSHRGAADAAAGNATGIMSVSVMLATKRRTLISNGLTIVLPTELPLCDTTRLQVATCGSDSGARFGHATGPHLNP
jgi:hypothetical protein